MAIARPTRREGGWEALAIERKAARRSLTKILDDLRRIAVREELDQSDVTRRLEGVALAALDRANYRCAGFLPIPYLRTLDALHLEAAMRLDASAVLTYDDRLGEAAGSAELDVITPGADAH